MVSANKKALLVQKNSSAAIDMAKWIFSVLIVMLHSGVDLGPLTPLYRIPVPCFFLFSSYFLFTKMAQQPDDAARNAVLIKFVQRNLKLYAFWFIVQLPALVFAKLQQGLQDPLTEILLALKHLCFGSTFTASWYITATIIDVCLVYWLSRKLNRNVMLALGIAAYAVCLMFSNYYGLVEWCLPLRYAFTAFTTVFNSVVTGFPAGILWIVVGKRLAERPVAAKKIHYLILLLGALGLLAEHAVVSYFGWKLVDDQYIMLVPTCCALFCVLNSAAWSWKHSVRFRNMSTIIYTSHGSILMVVTPILAGCVAVGEKVLRAGCVLLIAILLSVVIFILEKRKALAWLKYSH